MKIVLIMCHILHLIFVMVLFATMLFYWNITIYGVIKRCIKISVTDTEERKNLMNGVMIGFEIQ